MLSPEFSNPYTARLLTLRNRLARLPVLPALLGAAPNGGVNENRPTFEEMMAVVNRKKGKRE